MKQSAAVVTLGCKTNQFESAAMIEELERAGYQLIDFDQGADLVVVNTCTVTAATDSQSRNLIRRAQRMNTEARIVVTGCYAQVDPQALSDLPGVALVIGNNEKKQFLDYLTNTSEDDHIRVSDISHSTTMEPLEINSFAQRSRAFVQVQNGCNAFCSYCIIPYARGRSRSVAIDEVVQQVETLADHGHAEVVLTGIHIGQYGQDFADKIDLLDLLKRIKASSFQGRLRLGSIEPNELSAEFYHYVLEQDWICPHFHIPLQAGDDEVLRRMNRHYSTTFYRQLVIDIRQSSSDAAIGLDIISGFPGETEEQFERTRHLLEELPFTHLHVFPFSKRSGTPAANMPDQLPGDVIKERAKILRQIGDVKYQRYLEQFVGQRVELVIEGGENNGKRKGLTQHYLPVWVPAENTHQGQLLNVLVTGYGEQGLDAELID
jgi:threonylcarbamoyladenosine tRNA methylthiotransferase MtaB